MGIVNRSHSAQMRDHQLAQVVVFAHGSGLCKNDRVLLNTCPYSTSWEGLHDSGTITLHSKHFGIVHTQCMIHCRFYNMRGQIPIEIGRCQIVTL